MTEGDIEALAKLLDPSAFRVKELNKKEWEFRSHIKARRLFARRTAREIEVFLTKRGLI
jgi:hypothetical protein